jgi:hypothetical protein
MLTISSVFVTLASLNLRFLVLIQGKTHVLSQPSALSNQRKSRILEARAEENQRSC